MRRLSGKLRSHFWSRLRIQLCGVKPRVVLLAPALLICAGKYGQSQLQEPPTQFPTQPSQPGQNPGRVPFGQEQPPNQDPVLRRAQLEAARRRSIDRQNRMVAEADKILQLAGEINTAVDASGSHSLQPSMLKKTEEIEKLARSVKERMKSE